MAATAAATTAITASRPRAAAAAPGATGLSGGSATMPTTTISLDRTRPATSASTSGEHPAGVAAHRLTPAAGARETVDRGHERRKDQRQPHQRRPPRRAAACWPQSRRTSARAPAPWGSGRSRIRSAAQSARAIRAGPDRSRRSRACPWAAAAPRSPRTAPRPSPRPSTGPCEPTPTGNASRIIWAKKPLECGSWSSSSLSEIAAVRSRPDPGALRVVRPRLQRRHARPVRAQVGHHDHGLDQPRSGTLASSRWMPSSPSVEPSTDASVIVLRDGVPWSTRAISASAAVSDALLVASGTEPASRARHHHDLVSRCRPLACRSRCRAACRRRR